MIPGTLELLSFRKEAERAVVFSGTNVAFGVVVAREHQLAGGHRRVECGPTPSIMVPVLYFS